MKFRFFSKNKNTYALVLEKNIVDFDITAIANQLLDLIKENQPITKKSRIDLCIALRRRKKTIRLTLVVLYANNLKGIAFKACLIIL